MMLFFALALAVAPAANAEPIFQCSFGAKQLTVTQEGDALIYRYGTSRKAELRLAADADSGRVHYHRTLYARAEDQTLRFTNGDHDYIVYAHWSAPSMGINETSPEFARGGLIIQRGGKTLSSRPCKSGGDMREWPIFKTLPQDADNLIPAE